MQVAICDDDEGCCIQIKEWLQNYGIREKIDLQIEIYYNAEELLEHLQQHRWFDIIFLDIELPNKTGVELGREIRQRNDGETNIIFISGKTEYCMELFELEPLNFHQKPLSEKKICGDMDKVVCRIKNGRQILHYIEDGVKKGIYLKNILYVEAVVKKIKVTTVSGKEIYFRDKLHRIQESLEPYNFCRCHRAYIVNLAGIQSYRGRTLILKNGESIYVGEKFAEKLKNALTSYELVEE